MSKRFTAHYHKYLAGDGAAVWDEYEYFIVDTQTGERSDSIEVDSDRYRRIMASGYEPRRFEALSRTDELNGDDAEGDTEEIERIKRELDFDVPENHYRSGGPVDSGDLAWR